MMNTTQIATQHSFYLKVCEMVSMGLNIKKAHRVLGELLEIDNGWRVVGITEGALCKFKEQNFESWAHQGIQRAHLENRQERNIDFLLNPRTNAIEWYKELMKRDKTVLALSSENKALEGDNNIKIHWFDNQEQIGDLFKTHSFKWKHKEEEIECLECLYSITR